jgi:hypothetical protein
VARRRGSFTVGVPFFWHARPQECLVEPSRGRSILVMRRAQRPDGPAEPRTIVVVEMIGDFGRCHSAARPSPVSMARTISAILASSGRVASVARTRLLLGRGCIFNFLTCL